MSNRQELDQPFQPRKHKQDDAELDITPMIDIVFLLLSFFVVASKMDPSAAVPIPPARFGETISEKNCVCLLIFEGTTPENPDIFRGRSREPADRFTNLEPTVLEEEIAKYVDSEISRRPNVEGILIKAAGGVTSGIVQIVQRGVAQSEMATERQLQIYSGVEEDE
jgi:biopolymer transport protein ExbD